MNTTGGMGNIEAFGLTRPLRTFSRWTVWTTTIHFLNLNNSGASNLLLGSNEIQEADVVTNGFSGAYGSLGGINVNYVTKSGGNDFHGNPHYYWTGRAMDANDWFNKAEGGDRPFNNANQWAASIGGPIKKDKLFFFLNTEGLRVLIPVPSIIHVPTVAFRTGHDLQPQFARPWRVRSRTTVRGLTVFVLGSVAAPGVGAGVFNLYNSVPGDTTAPDFRRRMSWPSKWRRKPHSRHVWRPGTRPDSLLNTLQVTPINFAPEWQLAGRVDWNIGANDRAFVARSV